MGVSKNGFRKRPDLKFFSKAEQVQQLLQKQAADKKVAKILGSREKQTWDKDIEGSETTMQAV